MKLLGVLTTGLLLLGWAAAKAPPVDSIHEDLQLATAEVLHTKSGIESHVYQFPNPALRVKEGSTISVFGVKTSGDFQLLLYPMDSRNAKAFTLKKSKDGKGWRVKYGSASHNYPDSFNLAGDKFVWFLIERTNDYLALYRIGEAKPILTASNKVLRTKLNFNDLIKFRVISEKEGTWDFLGYQYNKDEVPQPVKYPFLDTVVKKVTKAYKIVVQHLKRCEYAEANVEGATSANNAKFFLTMFSVKNCKDKKVMNQLRDMRVRYKTIIRAAGVTPPAPPTDEECKKYIMDFKSLRL